MAVQAKVEVRWKSKLGTEAHTRTSHFFQALAATVLTVVLDEYERREADPAMPHWLRNEGNVPFPVRFAPHRMFPGPSGYRRHFGRLYRGDFRTQET